MSASCPILVSAFDQVTMNESKAGNDTIKKTTRECITPKADSDLPVYTDSSAGTNISSGSSASDTSEYGESTTVCNSCMLATAQGRKVNRAFRSSFPVVQKTNSQQARRSLNKLRSYHVNERSSVAFHCEEPCAIKKQIKPAEFETVPATVKSNINNRSSLSNKKTSKKSTPPQFPKCIPFTIFKSKKK